MPISGQGRDPRDQTWAGSCIWQDLYDYLRTGESELHGVAAGAMASVVHSGLAKLPDADMHVGADLNLTHPADPILTRGWMPTV